MDFLIKIVDCFILKSNFFFLEENFENFSLEKILNIHYQILVKFEKNIFFVRKLEKKIFINFKAFLKNLESFFYYHLNWFLILKIFIIDIKNEKNLEKNFLEEKFGFLNFLKKNFLFLKKYQKILEKENFFLI